MAILVRYQWRILAQTQMARNFSSQQPSKPTTLKSSSNEIKLIKIFFTGPTG